MNYLVQITRSTREEDVPAVEFDNADGALIFVAQNAMTPDGYRIVAFESGPEQPLRPGSKARLRTFRENLSDNTDTHFDTLGDALTAVAALHVSDGYELTDDEDWPGRVDPPPEHGSRLYQSWPPLWQTYYQTDPGLTYLDSRINDHGRNDADRI